MRNGRRGGAGININTILVGESRLWLKTLNAAFTVGRAGD